MEVLEGEIAVIWALGRGKTRTEKYQILALLERSPKKSLWVQVMLPSLQSNVGTGAGAALRGSALSLFSRIFSCTWLKNGIWKTGWFSTAAQSCGRAG